MAFSLPGFPQTMGCVLHAKSRHFGAARQPELRDGGERESIKRISEHTATSAGFRAGCKGIL